MTGSNDAGQFDPWQIPKNGFPTDAKDHAAGQLYLRAEAIGNVEPLDRQFGVRPKKTVPDALHDVLFGQPKPSEADIVAAGNVPSAVPPIQTYAILDAAKVVNLPELLGASGLEHRCMFKGDTYDELKNVAPWIVKLEDNNDFTRRLFTGPDGINGLWDKEPGIYVRSRGTLDVMWRHFRHFTMLREKVMLRFCDPAVTYTILDYLATRKADAACWFMIADGNTVHDIIAPRRKSGELFRHKLADGVITHKDVSPGRVWGAEYQESSRQERELVASVELLTKLRSSAPPSWLPADDKTLFFYIQEAGKAARQYGLTQPETLTKFVYLGTICAPFFWREPATQKFLSAHRSRPDARFADFYKLFKRRAKNADVPWILPEH